MQGVGVDGPRAARGEATRWRVQVNGAVAAFERPVLISESVRRGTWVSVGLEGGRVPTAQVGNWLDITLLDGDSNSRSAPTWSLLCSRVTVEQQGAVERCGFEGVDPLAFAESSRDFRIRAGRLRFDALARQVLEPTVGPLRGASLGSGLSKDVGEDWSFQCQESGPSFLHRKAEALGSRLFWDRDSLDLRAAGCGVGAVVPAPPCWSIAVDSYRAASSTEFWWVDPRTLQADTQHRDGASGDPSRRRMVANARPVLPAVGGSQRKGGISKSLRLSTSDPTIRLGARLRMSDGSMFAVEEVCHHIESDCHYSNQVVAVPDGEWGVSEVDASAEVLGPFLGRVTHNSDPERRGRLRVCLLEDADQRPTPWIPLLADAAGAGHGVHWLPEIGSVVVMIAPAACPEQLFCLGSVRGPRQTADNNWCTQDNSRKVIVGRSGVQLYIDDERGEIGFMTTSALCKLGNDGKFTMQARSASIETEESISMEGGRHVKINAERIDLG